MDNILEDMDVSGKAAFYSVFYNEELYVLSEQEATVKAPEEPTVNINDPLTKPAEISLHNNKKADLLLLFNYPGAQDIPAEDEALLKRVLGAANIEFADVAWLNTSAYPEIHWTDIETTGVATKIIAFGINPNLLPALLTEGQLYEHDGRQILNVTSLTEMHDSDDRKKPLWKGMKALLNLT